MKKIDIKIPTDDEINEMNLDELKTWRDTLEPYYDNRFDYGFPDRLICFKYTWFKHMIENIENNIDRWEKIKTR